MYDVALGVGKVVNVDESSERIVVKFGNRTIGYDREGRGIFAAKTLFWHDPYFGVTPPKDQKYWLAFKNAASAMSKELAVLGKVDE